jgi:hypothetical protein
LLKLLRRRSIANLLLDFVFVVWVAYFLMTGNLLPSALLASNPTTQATNLEEPAPAAPLLLDDDRAQFERIYRLSA